MSAAGRRCFARYGCLTDNCNRLIKVCQMDDQTESHLPLCKVPDEGEFKQDDLCKAYIEIMRKMSEIPVNADPRTVAFIFGRPVRDVNESVSLRPIMVSASLLSIDSFAPVVIRERRKNPPVKSDAERRFNSWNLDTGR